MGLNAGQLSRPCPMVSHEEIKTEAIRLHRDSASPEGIKKMAEIAVALCNRLADAIRRE
jgi:hypothetical protein